MSLDPRTWNLFGRRVTREGSRPADLAIVNARILTSDRDNPRASALAVKDGRFTCVGDGRGVRDFIGPETRVVDGRGRVVTPGFIDNHCHVLWIGALTSLMCTDLFFCGNPEEMREVVGRQAREHPDSLIVMAQGWKPHCLPEGVDMRALLDSWMPDRPVALMSYMAVGWVNSKMLELMEERNPAALALLVPERSTDGGYNGLLRHFHAFNPLDFVTLQELGAGAEEGMMAAMTRSLDDALLVGVTTMDDVQVYRPFFPTILEFRKRGGLEKARVRCGLYVPNDALTDEDGFRERLQWWKEFGEAESDDHLVLGRSLKFYIDGVASNHAALNFEPYCDDPDCRGDEVWSQEDFDRVIDIIDSMGLQACTHCCGDRGINRVINSYEKALEARGDRDIRHRADHCSRPLAEDIPRMADLGVLAAMQPSAFFGDETIERVLGPERLQLFQPWGSMERAGVEMSFGSDWCAGPFNPVYGLLVAGTRLNYRFRKDWGPKEGIRIEDAIRHWTIDSARALKMEDDIGSIEVGKLADFVVFNTDPRKLSSWWFLLTHDLKLGALDGFVDATVVGGKVVHSMDGAVL